LRPIHWVKNALDVVQVEVRQTRIPGNADPSSLCILAVLPFASMCLLGDEHSQRQAAWKAHPAPKRRKATKAIRIGGSVPCAGLALFPVAGGGMGWPSRVAAVHFQLVWPGVLRPHMRHTRLRQKGRVIVDATMHKTKKKKEKKKKIRKQLKLAAWSKIYDTR